jgi:hypothetical protein
VDATLLTVLLQDEKVGIPTKLFIGSPIKKKNLVKPKACEEAVIQPYGLPLDRDAREHIWSK